MTKIRELIVKRCFYTRKDGSKGVLVHKSVELSEGSIIRFHDGEWKFSSIRQNTKIATSLQLKAMLIAKDNASTIEYSEKFTDFKKFSARMAGIVGVDEFMKIVNHLK